MNVRRIVIILLLLLVGWAVYSWISAEGEADKPKYRTEPLTRGDLSSKVSATGSLQAVTKITVGSEVSGKIERLYVDFNSRVKKGDILAELDPSTFRAQVEQQQASLADAQASLDASRANQANSQASVHRSEATIESARAQIEQARAQVANNKASYEAAEANVDRGKADLDNTRVDFERATELRKRDLIAQSEVDDARALYRQSQASLSALESQKEAAQATYRASQASLSARQADLLSAQTERDGAMAQAAASAAQVRSAQAKVRQSQANLEQAQVNLGRTTLRSPIDGIVLDRKVTIGQTVAAQFQAPDLFTLAQNLDQMQVEAAVDEADIGQVKTGATATFTVDAFPEETFQGTVTEVRKAPVVTSNVVTYTVIIRTQNKGLRLMPGMTATVAIQVETREDVLLAPNEALRFQPPEGALKTLRSSASPSPASSASPRQGRRGGGRGGPRLFTVENGQLKPHRVETGITDGVSTEITESDLKEGDPVVVETITATPRPVSTGSSNGGGSRRGPRLF